MHSYQRRALISVSICAAALIGLLLAGGSAESRADDPPAGSQPAYHKAEAPAGFKTIKVGSITAWAEPADEKWVAEAIAAVKPVTRPSTMPSDVATKIEAKKAEIVAMMKADLALTDDKALTTYLDDKVIAPLKLLEVNAPTVYFLVVDGEKLKDIVRSGWGTPQFSINRLTNLVNYDANVHMPADGRGDDAVIPLIYGPQDTPDQKSAGLKERIMMNELQRLNNIAQFGQIRALGLLMEGIRHEAIEPLKLPRSQEWFATGVVNWLGAKYIEPIIGVDARAILAQLTNPGERNPVNPFNINLMNPTAEDILLPQAVPYYNASLRARGTAVVAYWVNKTAEGMIPKVLGEIRTKKPADGPALVKIIEAVSGQDLTPVLIERQ